jgi:hypothetical protein
MTTISNSKIETAQAHQPENQYNTFQLAQASNTAPGSINPVVNNATAEQAVGYFNAFSDAKAPVAVGTYLLPNGNFAAYGRWVEDFGPNNINTYGNVVQDMEVSAAEAIKQGILPEGTEFFNFMVEPSNINNGMQILNPTEI